MSTLFVTAATNSASRLRQSWGRCEGAGMGSETAVDDKRDRPATVGPLMLGAPRNEDFGVADQAGQRSAHECAGMAG